MDVTFNAEVKYGETRDNILCLDDEIVKDSKTLVLACSFCAELDDNVSMYCPDDELGKESIEVFMASTFSGELNCLDIDNIMYCLEGDVFK